MKRKNIIFAIFGIVLVLGLTITSFAMEAQATTLEDTTISEAYIPSEASEEEIIVLDIVEVTRIEPTTLEEAEQSYKIAINRYETAQNAYNSLISLGYLEEHPAVVLTSTEINNSEKDCTYYKEILEKFQEEHRWKVRAEEYPVATQAWLYMKNELGYSDIVCAGIMGNLMAECGGCWTSDLHYNVSSSSGYGMIQWLGGRKNQLFSIYGNNPTVEEQLEFMNNELYGTNGVTKQVTDAQLNEIMNASTPGECAYAFASYFERCAQKHRAPRRGYAETAYEYFVD